MPDVPFKILDLEWAGRAETALIPMFAAPVTVHVEAITMSGNQALFSAVPLSEYMPCVRHVRAPLEIRD